jgi:hypothetical protein
MFRDRFLFNHIIDQIRPNSGFEKSFDGVLGQAARLRRPDASGREMQPKMYLFPFRLMKIGISELSSRSAMRLSCTSTTKGQFMRPKQKIRSIATGKCLGWKGRAQSRFGDAPSSRSIARTGNRQVRRRERDWRRFAVAGLHWGNE